MKKFVAIILVFLLSSTSAHALIITAEELAALQRAPISECSDRLQVHFEAEMQEFLTFIDNNFKNKSANSSLINIATSRYSEFKIGLKQILGTMSPGRFVAAELAKDPIETSFFSPDEVEAAVLVTYADEVAAYATCVDIMEFYAAAAKEQMMRHIANNTSQKKTLIMLEKYQSINTNLRKLNLEISQMYGYFMTFKNRLPGYVKQCVQS